MVQGINFENNLQKKMAQEGLMRTGRNLGIGKTLATYAPFVGDTMDIGAGINKIRSGHPYIGLGQAGIGAVGLGMDTAALLAAPFTGGSSILGEQALKQAGKRLIKAGGKQLMKYATKDAGKKFAKRQGASLGLEGIYQMTKNTDAKHNKQYTQTNVQPPLKTIYNSQLPLDNIPTAGYPSIEQIIASSGGSGQVPIGAYDDVRGIDIQTIDSLNQQPNQQSSQQPIGDIAGLLQAYQAQQQALQQPYVDALQNYLDNYGEYTKGSRNAQRYYTAMAGLSGNQGYRDLAKQYDPMVLELNRIQLVKALQEAKAGNVGNINELVGNASIAQAMGLSPEAALANKNLLNAFTAQQKAQYGLQGKMYGADQSYNARVYSTNIDNATKLAIARGRMDIAVKLQRMKGNAGAVNALINTVGFGGDPEAIMKAVEQFGNPTGLQFVRQQQGGGAPQGGAPISGLNL